MKVLFILREEENAWVKEYFPHDSPYMLSFLGKPLLEYFFDFFDLLGLEKVRLSMNDGSSEIESRYGNGSDHGYHFFLDYSFHGQEKLEQIFLKNYRFLKEQDVWIFDGFFFFHYDKRNLKKQMMDLFCQNPKSSWKKHQEDSQIYFIPNFSKFSFESLMKNDLSCATTLEKKDTHFSFLISQIKTISDYYDACMRILTKEKECYVLLGYRNVSSKMLKDDAIILGRGVELGNKVQLKPEVYIGDFVTVEENSTIGPNVILGNYTHVGGESFLSDSILYDGVYLGKSLTLEKSILTTTHLLRIDKNESIPIEDPLFFNQTNLSPFKKKTEWVIFHQIAAFFFFLFFFSFFYFFQFSFLMSKFFLNKSLVQKKKKTIFSNQEQSHLEIIRYQRISNYWFVRLFFSFSLDKFPLLFAVMKRNMSLVGNEPLLAIEKNIFEINKVKNYRASIFSFSSAYGMHDGLEKDINYFSEIEERYFSHHRSVITYLKTLISSIKKNFVKQWRAKRQ